LAALAPLRVDPLNRRMQRKRRRFRGAAARRGAQIGEREEDEDDVAYSEVMRIDGFLL
jgi:hypothetical protein